MANEDKKDFNAMLHDSKAIVVMRIAILTSLEKDK